MPSPQQMHPYPSCGDQLDVDVFADGTSEENEPWTFNAVDFSIMDQTSWPLPMMESGLEWGAYVLNNYEADSANPCF